MSATYKPGFIPDDPAQMAASIRQEFASIKRGMEDESPSLDLVVLHAAPSRIRAGMLVYADGADWNPGAGEGVYRREKTNTSWVLVG